MQIHKLSNQELESQLLRFVRQERKLLHLIILHIREVDKRKLYLEKARPSLYEYLVKDLGYSSSAAQRRIEAARLLKDIPGLADKIQWVVSHKKIPLLKSETATGYLGKHSPLKKRLPACLFCLRLSTSSK